MLPTSHHRSASQASLHPFGRPIGLDSPFDRRSAPVYRLIVLQTGVILALILALGFGATDHDILIVTTVLVVGIIFAMALRRRGINRVATAIEGMALMLGSGICVACLSGLLATISPPYADTWLAEADARLFPFISWPHLVAALGKHAALTAAMCRIYGSLLWQPFALIILLCATNRTATVWRLLHAWLIALTMCVTIFAIAPAVTPYVHYGFTPSDFPALTVNAGWRPAQIIAQFRDGQIRDLAASNMGGLVTFPSFHAAAAILLGWHARRVPWAGPVIVALNALMILTVPFIGSHYFVDVLGGGAVAIVAIRLAHGPMPTASEENP